MVRRAPNRSSSSSSSSSTTPPRANLYLTISASLGSLYEYSHICTQELQRYIAALYPAAQSSSRQPAELQSARDIMVKTDLPRKIKLGSHMVTSVESKRTNHLELFRLVVFFAWLSCCSRARTSTSPSSALSATSSPAKSRASLARTRRSPNAWDHSGFLAHGRLS